VFRCVQNRRESCFPSACKSKPSPAQCDNRGCRQNFRAGDDPEFWRQGFAVNQQVNNGFEFRQILAASSGAFDVFLELAGAAESFSQPHISVEFFLAAKAFDAFAPLARLERVRGKFVWNPDVKGQAALQLDLPIEQMHRLGNSQAQIRKNVFNLGFKPGSTRARMLAVLLMRRM